MLILGIEPRTPQVSVAIGGHEACSGVHPVGAGQATRRDPHARDRVHVQTGAVSTLGDQRGGSRPRPGFVHRSSCGRRLGQGDGARAASPDDRCTEPRPAGACRCGSVRGCIVAAIDARRGELFYAFYRQVPGGVQRLSPHQLGTPDDLASEILAPARTCLLVGDGALRYREVFEGLTKVEIADDGLAYPSATSLVQLAHAQALREQFVNPWDLQPLYLRKPDAEINWATRERRMSARRRRVELEASRGRRRADAAPASAERASHRGRRTTRRPMVARLVHERAGVSRRDASTSSPSTRAGSWASPGCCSRPRTATSRRCGRSRRCNDTGLATRMMLVLVAAGAGPRASRR